MIRPPKPFPASTRLPIRRLQVTVCIAIMCEKEDGLILISDKKVAFGITSVDKGAIKNIPLLRGCSVMIAGNDVAHAGPVISRSRQSLSSEKEWTIEEIANVVFQECVNERDRIIEASVL